MEKVFKALFSLFKPLLYPLSLIYGMAAWIRNKVYDKGIYGAVEFSVPVISVGNLSVGGTGKTPHIEYLIRLLQYEFKVATMSRGYKRKTSGFRLAAVAEDSVETIGDEPMQFFSNFPEIYVTVCADRMAGIPELIGLKPDTEVVLLDDAFQHRSVKPGLNILIMDYHRPFYRDYILPFGRLREGRNGYRRADVIIVSKCPEDLSEQEQVSVISQIKPLEKQQVFFSKINYLEFYDFFNGQKVTPAASSNFILVSGIARPKPLMDYLEQRSSFVHLLQYPDHHYFTIADLEEIRETFKGWEAADKAVVVSEKDAVRLALHKEKLQEWAIPVFVLPIEIQFLNNKTTFDQFIFDYIGREKEQDYFE